MKPLNLDEEAERTALIAEYVRLNNKAAEALRSDNWRARPNWHLLYDCHDELAQVVARMRNLNGH
ncbi:hypothetical protein [Tardiphaga sp.]|jgi:hypothetical protein|uniref:hypothetical protein n=1 Tax=Tardiphaga sp. TaxID=1926292 RepID=UPI00262DE6AB|nr:hypothetical protein [Tardiphaga sp.]